MQGDFAKQRVKLADAGWRGPLKWNRKSNQKALYQNDVCLEVATPRHRVFCASLADIFEDWDGPILDHEGRQWLWRRSGQSRVLAWPEDVESGDLDGVALPPDAPSGAALSSVERGFLGLRRSIWGGGRGKTRRKNRKNRVY